MIFSFDGCHILHVHTQEADMVYGWFPFLEEFSIFHHSSVGLQRNKTENQAPSLIFLNYPVIDFCSFSIEICACSAEF